MRNDIFVNLGELSQRIRATDTPLLWPEDTTISDLMEGAEMLYKGPQLADYKERLNECALVDVKLTIL